MFVKRVAIRRNSKIVRRQQWTQQTVWAKTNWHIVGFFIVALPQRRQCRRLQKQTSFGCFDPIYFSWKQQIHLLNYMQWTQVVQLDSEETGSALTSGQANGRVRIPLYEELLFVEKVVGNGVHFDVMDDMGAWVRVPLRQGDMVSIPQQLPYRLGIQSCTYTTIIRAFCP